MPTVHEKLKLAFVHVHPDDGLMLTVTTRDGRKFDMELSPTAAAMLLGQLTQGVKDALLARHPPCGMGPAFGHQDRP